MKKTVKCICIVLSVMIFSLCAVGCSDSSDDYSGSSSYNSGASVTTSSEAINAVKDYMSGTSLSLDQRIAGELGFQNFYDPQYGASSASQNSDGSWKVTLKGSMSGYVDDYHDDFESYKFEVSATVSESGDVSGIYVRKAY